MKKNAAYQGQSEVVRLLLHRGIDKDSWVEGEIPCCGTPHPYVTAGTPLCFAAQSGQVEVVRLLLSEGADIDKANAKGRTPLGNASRRGHVDVVMQLMVAGADRNKANMRRRTPLHEATYHGHTDVVALLVGPSVDLETADMDGKTVLGVAAEKGHVEIVQLVLRAGADKEKESKHSALCLQSGKCDAKSLSYATPLAIAFCCGHREVVKALLGSAEEPSKAEIKGSALPESFGSSKMFTCDGHAEVVRLLLGASTAELGYANRILIAALAGDDEKIQVLLREDKIRDGGSAVTTIYAYLCL